VTARTCNVQSGVLATSGAGYARARGCESRIGTLSAASSPAWSGRASANRAKVDWLLRPDEMWIDSKTGRPSPRFYQFIREIAEVRLGGIQGVSVPQVATAVTQTQAEVVATTSYAEAAVAYSQGVAATATATAQVTTAAALPGSESIPIIPEPPIRTNPDEYIP
jgi:hypothetical protein